MASWRASVESGRSLVGCFCVVSLLHEFREAFGADLECDGIDLLANHADRAAASAAELGILADSPAVLTAARNQLQFGPRYAFRLKAGPSVFVTGTLDRYMVQVTCEQESDFLEPAQSRFVAFLRSLNLGGVRVDGV